MMTGMYRMTNGCLKLMKSVIQIAKKFSVLFKTKPNRLDVGAVTADHQFELARFAHIVEVGVIKAEIVCCDIERYGLRFVVFQTDSPESFQFFDRPRDTACHIADIELYHLVGVVYPHIHYIECSRDFAQ